MLLLALAAVAGALVPVSPLAGIAVVGVLTAIGVLALGRKVIPIFHGALLIILVGYAFLGKGFAYLGVPPLYVGEMALSLCLASILWAIGRAKLTVLHALLFLFMAWGAIRTVPYIGEYGINALRDAATWVYAFFAIGVSLTVRPDHLGRLASGYRRFVPLFLVWLPIAAVVSFTMSASLPTVPGSGGVPILVFKAGDMSVTLAGVAAFLLLGLYTDIRPTSAFHELALWSLWLVGAGVTAALNRAALVALAAVAAVVLFVRASSRWISLLVVAAFLMILATFLDPTVDVGGPRAVSVDQLVANLTSVFSSSAGGDVNQATKAWREEWWNSIVNYTVNGPYFWTGKGFGINLADADGFQVLADDSLRAPHSTNLEVLARAGVPGLILWVTLQAGFAFALLRAAFRSYRTAPKWLPVFGWIFVYWLAALIDGSFDVYLGGPQGGIWFWSVIGLGIAAIRMSDEEPDLQLVPERTVEMPVGPRFARPSPVPSLAFSAAGAGPAGASTSPAPVAATIAAAPVGVPVSAPPAVLPIAEPPSPAATPQPPAPSPTVDAAPSPDPEAAPPIVPVPVPVAPEPPTVIEEAGQAASPKPVRKPRSTTTGKAPAAKAPVAAARTTKTSPPKPAARAAVAKTAQPKSTVAPKAHAAKAATPKAAAPKAAAPKAAAPKATTPKATTPKPAAKATSTSKASPSKPSATAAPTKPATPTKLATPKARPATASDSGAAADPSPKAKGRRKTSAP